MRTPIPFVLLLALALLHTSCGAVSQALGIEDPAGRQAVDSVELSSFESALLATSVDAADLTKTVNEIADDAALAGNTIFQPSGCAIVNANGATVTYQLTNCTGPYGLNSATGQAIAVYTLSGDTLNVNLTATNLSVENSTLSINSNATYSVTGTEKNLVVQTSGVGTGANGTVVTRAGQYTADWETATGCMRLNGAWTNTIGEEAWGTNVTNYEKCGLGCPKSGGNIIVAGTSGTTVTVEFNGTSAANVLSNEGNIFGTVSLECNS